jgi:hypothetical protein
MKKLMVASALISSMLMYSKAFAQNDSPLNKVDVRKGCGTHYFLSKPESEKSLDALCRQKNVKKEDAWLQIGDTLVDIGQVERRSKVFIPNDSILKYMGNARSGDTITFFHNHPKSYKRRKFYPPSREDIFIFSYIKNEASQRGLVFQGAVFDGRGKWETDTSTEFYEMIEMDRNSKINRKYFSGIIQECRNMDMWGRKNKAGVSGEFSPHALEKYISTMKMIGVSVNYTPSNVLQKR